MYAITDDVMQTITFLLRARSLCIVLAQKHFVMLWQVHPQTSVEDLDELASLLQVPLVAGTVNRYGLSSDDLQTLVVTLKTWSQLHEYLSCLELDKMVQELSECAATTANVLDWILL